MSWFEGEERGDAINIVYATIKGAVSECTLLKGTLVLF